MQEANVSDVTLKRILIPCFLLHFIQESKNLNTLHYSPNNNHIMVENEGPGVMLYENGVIGEPSGLEGAPGLSNEGAGDFDPIIPGEKLHINSLEQQQIYLQKPDGDTVDEKYTNTGVCDNVNSRDSLNNTIITWLNTHHRGSCIVATFSPDGYLLASGSKDASIKIVDVDRINRAAGSLEPKPVTRTLQHHTGQINDIKFHPAGSVLVSASDDGTVRFFDATKTSLRRSFKNIQVGAPVKSLSFHPSGDYFLIGVSTRKILLYDTHTTKSYCPIEKSCITSYPCVRFAPHGAYYATADGSPRISIWDVVSSKNIYHITVADTPDYPEAPLHPAVKLVDLCWNSDGTQITVCNHDASISSYDIRTGGLLSKYRGTLSKVIIFRPPLSYVQPF